MQRSCEIGCENEQQSRLPGWIVFFIATPVTLLTTRWQVLWIVIGNFQLSKKNYQMRCLLDCSKGQRLSKTEIENSVNIIVDLVVVRARSNSEYLSISMQNLSKVLSVKSLVRKLKLARDQTRHLIVRTKPLHAKPSTCVYMRLCLARA